MNVPTDLGLLVKALPAVVLAVVAKLVADLVGADPVELNALHSGLVAANVFLIGFLLAGTLTDYKESEKLPSEVAVRVENIADECEILYRDIDHEAPMRCLEHLQRLSGVLREWLDGKQRSVDEVLDEVDGLNAFFLEFQPLTQPNFIVRLKQEQSALRQIVTRIDTIRETSFVGAGYVISYVTSVLLLVGLVVTDFASLGAELFLVGTIAFLLAYMIVLIRDLDDPFQNGRDKGSAEVSLAPLDRLAKRLQARVARISVPR